ncbi:TonB-dependent receptor [Alloprevotella sp. OH1205_COT-284]|uniref:TonB-dependent receptor n=1 Tax=Alloprevotella sp. OH1205_COT-284 TaxID=2491043 RepID=UPI000F5E34DA|nr:TonB-dependent receptor [Alloprevotella sp. OH1205_COT-284]RRD80200.1 TonB-dependent receptor [Alloprevotella sp. OH1205_COT-284]
MKKFVLAGCCAAATAVSAQGVDTIRVNILGEAQVVTNRATKKSPIAYSNLDKAALERINHGQDIPFLLSTLPSVVATSDAGTGIGYTNIRVRGTDGTRINITNNGIPLNDPESHVFYWVDVPDFASSLQDIQLQRGVGTSTNGAGAFGASINMLTDKASLLPYASVNASYGSFNTTKNTLKVGTGRLNHRWAFDARVSYLASDGYRDRSSAQMGSYFTQGTYFNGGTMLKLIAYGGKEKTYHAWDGISREQLSTHRTYNPNGLIDKKLNLFYDDQNDIYFQQHAQALLTQKLSPAWSLSAALHYTYGEGYYEEYKKNRKLTEYGLASYTLDAIEQKKSDLIRRKHLQNHFYGGLFSLNYKEGAWDVTGGAGLNNFENDHFGNVLWVKNYVGNLRPNHEYYRNKGEKLDGNVYLRAHYAVLPTVNLFADVQYRFIDYRINGTSDKRPVLDIDKKFHFFNPKFGGVWNIRPDHRVYASFSVARREPTRNSYQESYSPDHSPKSERLFDYEAGYTYTGRTFEAAVNGYWMQYKNQFVLNGRYNEIGEAVVENVADSHRAGIELSGAWLPCPFFRWDANLTLSANRIKDYTAYLYDGDYNEYTHHIGDTDISFSPSTTFNNRFTFNHGGFSASLTSQYVGRQYLDNMKMRENSLDAYFVSHLNASYTFCFRGVKEMTVGATVYNLFNEKYETNGYSQTYMADPATRTLGSDPRFYPMAGTNFLVNIGVKF